MNSLNRQFIWCAVAVLAWVQGARAFTNGTNLPEYLCQNQPGKPMSLGQVLNYFAISGAALTVANYHNQNSTKAQQGVITIQNTNSPACQMLMPGSQLPLTLVSTSAMDGAIVYAVDAHANRVGSFVAFGPNMVPWAACGPNNVGIVHSTLLTDQATYPGIVWQAPACICGPTITFKGLAVTDMGFGFHNTTFTVANAQCAAGGCCGQC